MLAYACYTVAHVNISLWINLSSGSQDEAISLEHRWVWLLIANGCVLGRARSLARESV